jgi:hypothetical protein
MLEMNQAVVIDHVVAPLTQPRNESRGFSEDAHKEQGRLRRLHELEVVNLVVPDDLLFRGTLVVHDVMTDPHDHE